MKLLLLAAMAANLIHAAVAITDAPAPTPGADTDSLLNAPAATPTPASPREGLLVPDLMVMARQADPTIAYVERYVALGCFEDGGILTATATRNIDMTPNICRNWCSVQEAAIFGLKGGTQCFCGTEIEEFAEKAEEDECTSSCFGSRSVLCGGQNHLNLYAPTDADVGSFSDNAPTVTPTSGSGSDDDDDEEDSGSNSDSNSGSSSPTSASSDSDSDSTSALVSDSTTQLQEDDDEEEVPSSAPGGAGLSAGTTIGVAVGAAAISGIITAFVIYCFCRRRSRRYRNDAAHDPRFGPSGHPPSQPMVYAGTAAAVPHPQSPLPQSSHAPHPAPPMRGPAQYKPHDAATAQAYGVSPQSASPPPSNTHEMANRHPPTAFEMPTNHR